MFRYNFYSRGVVIGLDSFPSASCIRKLTNRISVHIVFHRIIASIVAFCKCNDAHKEYITAIRRTEIGNSQFRIVVDDRSATHLKCKYIISYRLRIQMPVQFQFRLALDPCIVIFIQAGSHFYTVCDLSIAGQRCKHGRCQTEAKRQCQGQCEYSFYLFHSLVSFLLQFY